MGKKKRKHSRKQARKRNFGLSLERYTYKRIAGLPIKWEWVGIAIGGMIIAMSIMNGYFKSSTLFGNTTDIIKTAAGIGDYGTAQRLYESNYESRIMKNVLGAEAQLEEQVYPERKIQNEITRQELLLSKYPGSRDIFLTLEQLYKEAGNREKAQEYRETARVLDPNNPLFSEK